jgi:hypothetical protein
MIETKKRSSLIDLGKNTYMKEKEIVGKKAKKKSDVNLTIFQHYLLPIQDNC